MIINPPVSIIVPVYNTENYLSKCIDSILAQTFSDFELLLIDDGSSDRSGNICDKYAKQDDRIKVFHKKNEGVSIARNLGLNNANGKWIAFIDSDDWVEKNFIQCYIDSALSHDCIVLQGIYRDMLLYNGKTESIQHVNEKYIINKNNADKSKEIWHNGYLCNKLFSKKIIDKGNIRFNEELNLHEDHIFYYEYLLHVKVIIFVSNLGYHYIIRDEISLTKVKQTSNRYFKTFDLFLSYYPKLEEHFGLVDEEYKASCIQSYGLRQLIMGFFCMYLEDIPFNIRYNILINKRKYLLYFKKFFHCHNFKDWYFYLVYRYFSIGIQDILFKCAVRSWQINKLIHKKWYAKFPSFHL